MSNKVVLKNSLKNRKLEEEVRGLKRTLKDAGDGLALCVAGTITGDTDYMESQELATIYGVLVGWSSMQLEVLREKFNWDDKFIAKVTQGNEAVKRVIDDKIYNYVDHPGNNPLVSKFRLDYNVEDKK